MALPRFLLETIKEAGGELKREGKHYIYHIPKMGTVVISRSPHNSTTYVNVAKKIKKLKEN